MTYPQQPPPPQYAAPQPKNGMGTAALVLGIIGIVLAWIPIIGFFGFVLGGLAVIFGAIAFGRARKGVATNKGMSIAGLLSGVVALVVSTIVFVAFTMVVDKEMQQLEAELRSAPELGAPAPIDGEQEGDAASASEVVRLSFGEQHTWPGGETISVSQPQEYTADNPFMGASDGNRLVSLDVTIVNNSDDEYNVMGATFTAQHNGRAAQQNMNSDMLPNVQLPPGGNTTFTLVHEVGSEPGKLQLSVQPNYFAENTVYFSGKF